MRRIGVRHAEHGWKRGSSSDEIVVGHNPAKLSSQVSLENWKSHSTKNRYNFIGTIGNSS